MSFLIVWKTLHYLSNDSRMARSNRSLDTGPVIVNSRWILRKYFGGSVFLEPGHLAIELQVEATVDDAHAAGRASVRRIHDPVM